MDFLEDFVKITHCLIENVTQFKADYPSERSSGNLVADDNGSECINQVITDGHRNPACPIPFTRSPDHQKNDHCLRTSGPSRTEKRRLRP